MSTHRSAGAPAPPEHSDVRAQDAHSDQRLSVAVLIMLSSLAVLFALIVPAAIVLLHRAAGY